MSFVDLPADVVKQEILSKLDVKSLGKVERVNKDLNILGREALVKEINNGILRKEGWGPEQMYNLAKNNTEAIKIAVIKDFLYRLHYRTPILDFIMQKVPNVEQWVINYLNINPNVTDEEKGKYPNYDWSVFFLKNIEADSNYGIYEFTQGIEEWPGEGVDHLFKGYSRNINLRAKDVFENSKSGWDWTSIGKNPNITGSFILNHPSFKWTGSVFINPNISPNELLSGKSKLKNYIQPRSISLNSLGEYFYCDNPNTTLDYVEKYVPITPIVLLQLSENEFTRNSDYRYLVYSYIYRLLPDQVTIKIGPDTITSKKSVIYGMLATIFNLKLDYDIFWEDLKLNPEDYRMFTDNTANHRYRWYVQDATFNFSVLNNFLIGAKKVYEINKIPFSSIAIYDRKNKVSINVS